MTFKNFRKAGHPPSLIAAFLHFDMNFMVWVLIGALGIFISQDFHLTAAQKGFLTAIPLLGGALTRIPIGLLGDRLGIKRVALAQLVIVCLPLLWGWLGAGSCSEMLVLGLLLGVAGSSFALALPLASRWYPPEYQGLAMGIAGAGNSGTILASIFAPRLAKAYGWHAVFALALGCIAVTFAAFAFLAKEPPRQGSKQGWKELLSVFRQIDSLWFSIVYSVTFGGFVGFASFLNLFFFDQYGLNKIQAANLTALCVFSGSFFRPIGGFVSDRIGGYRALIVLLGVIAGSLAVMGTLPALAIALPALFIMMAALGMGNGAVFQLVPQRFAKEIGLMTGIVGAAGGFGGFFLPTLMGWVKQHTGSFGPAFWILMGGVGFALAALYQAQQGILRYRNKTEFSRVAAETVINVPCDGKIFVTPVERAVTVRTGEPVL